MRKPGFNSALGGNTFLTGYKALGAPTTQAPMAEPTAAAPIGKPNTIETAKADAAYLQAHPELTAPRLKKPDGSDADATNGDESAMGAMRTALTTGSNAKLYLGIGVAVIAIGTFAYIKFVA